MAPATVDLDEDPPSDEMTIQVQRPIHGGGRDPIDDPEIGDVAIIIIRPRRGALSHPGSRASAL